MMPDVGEFDESQHPRDGKGQFTDGGGADGPKGEVAKVAQANASRAHAAMLEKAPGDSASAAELRAHAERVKRVSALHATAAKASSEAAREALDRGQYVASTAHSSAAIDHMTKASDTGRAVGDSESRARSVEIRERAAKEAASAEKGVAAKSASLKSNDPKDHATFHREVAAIKRSSGDEAGAKASEAVAAKYDKKAEKAEKAGAKEHGEKKGEPKEGHEAKGGHGEKGSASKGEKHEGKEHEGKEHEGGLAHWIEKSIEKAHEGIEKGGEIARETIKAEPLENIETPQP